jgi:hypothetical protein
MPTSTSTLPSPTDTPKPPEPANADDHVLYPGRSIGRMIAGGFTFDLYQGVNAPDGSLLLPSYNKSAALYNNVLWVHRIWADGWLDIAVGDEVMINGQLYIIVRDSYIDYGIYPKTLKFGGVQYIASCYSDDAGKWVGVELYRLVKE